MKVASYRSPKTVVTPSGIAGRGLYAAASLACGEVVCVKGGHLIDRATLERRWSGTGRQGTTPTCRSPMTCSSPPSARTSSKG